MSDNRQALVEVQPGQPGRVRSWFRGRGRPNNIKTLMRMRAMVRISLGLDGAPENTELAQIADNILDGWDIKTGEDYAICEAVHYFIYNNISYTQDRAGGYERLQWPLETLRRKRGDCDDLEILEASLLGLCGIQDIWFEAAKYFEETEGEDHVYGFAKINTPETAAVDGILYHDSTATITEDKPLGWRESNTLEIIQVPIFQDEHNTLVSSLGGFWKSIGNIVASAIGPVIGLIGGGGGGEKEQQTKEIGKTFEEGAKNTVDYFNSIQQPGRPITVEEYNTAAGMLAALADFADNYPLAYVKGKWNSGAYKPVFEERLEQIKTVALATANGKSANSGTGSNTNTNSASGTSDTESLIEKYGPLALVGLVIAFALRG